MVNKYEKHQRDYPILATSVILREFFSKNLYKVFPFIPGPIYVLVENGILYHFISEEDYKKWPSSWLENNSSDDLKKYRAQVDKVLKKYREFLSSDHTNIEEDLRKDHYYLKYFLPIIMLGAYLPNYGENTEGEIEEVALEIRKEYEDVHKKGMDLEVKLLNEIENKLKVDRGTLENMVEDEFEEFLKNKNIPEGIKNRKNFVLIEYSKDGEKVFANREEAQDKLKLIETKIETGITEFGGQVAFPGKIKNIVRIARLVEDAQELEDGEVLVASMTDPRYLPVMKKAGAIITDEGGIACHAAIVSREMKKPCIVGTKIATQILKNGDLVEVDADNGTVKIIK